MTHKLTQDEVEKVHVLNTGGKNPPPLKKKNGCGSCRLNEGAPASDIAPIKADTLNLESASPKLGSFDVTRRGSRCCCLC